MSKTITVRVDTKLMRERHLDVCAHCGRLEFGGTLFVKKRVFYCWRRACERALERAEKQHPTTKWPRLLDPIKSRNRKPRRRVRKS